MTRVGGGGRSEGGGVVLGGLLAGNGSAQPDTSVVAGALGGSLLLRSLVEEF